MKKRYLSIVFSLLCVTLFCFLSCDDNIESTSVDGTCLSADTTNDILPTKAIDLSMFSDELDEEDGLAMSHMYTFQPLPEVSDGWEYLTNIIEFHDGMFCLYMRQEGERMQTLQNCIVYLDSDGSIAKTVPYTMPIIKHTEREDILESTRCRQMVDENTFLYSSYTLIMNPPGVENELDSGYLTLCDAAGTILKEALIPGTGTNDHLKRLSDGSIAVIGGESVCLFDAELNLIGQIESAAKTNLQETPHGELIAEGQFEGNYFRLDTENYASSAEILYEHPKHLTGIPRMHFSALESAYDVYYSNDTGFWGYHVGDAEAELLCNWQNSGQVYTNLTILGVLNADRILVSVKDPFTNAQTVGWLHRDPNTAEQKKIPIRIGLVEEPRNIGISTLTDQLKNAANSFNAHNSQYFIEIVQYGTRRDERGVVPDAFTEAMLNGTAADIIVTSEFIRDAMRIYTEKQAFVDLHPALGSVLLPCVQSAYEDQAGALYAIPTQMTLSVLVSRADAVGADEALTLNTMYALAQDAENRGIRLIYGGEYATTQTMRASALMSFTDKETGDCFFDSEEFGTFLLFLEDLRKQISDEQMLYYETYGTTHSKLYPSEIRDTVRAGENVFLEYCLRSMADLATLKLCYGDIDFALHGYPTRNEELVRFDSTLDFHLNAASKVKRGAVQFLSYLLSDEIQLYNAKLSLPVTVSAVERLLEHEAYVYEPSTLYRLDDAYDEETIALLYRDAIRVTYDEDDLALLRRLFYGTASTAETYETMSAIIDEEMMAYYTGIRTLEETQKILQSRLWIYVNE